MASIEARVKHLPTAPGVYIFKDRKGQVLYVGKSINVRERVKSHLAAAGPKSQNLVAASVAVECIPVNYELEALLVEAALTKKYLPRFNSRAKDDKHPLYIKITTGEEFPKVSTVRVEYDPKAIYFGPFPSSSTVRQVLRQIRKIFPYCAQKKVGKRPCFYSHLGLCKPCPAEIVRVIEIDIDKGGALRREYRNNIRKIVTLLKGKSKTLKRKLENEMKSAAQAQNFERAVNLRDQLVKLAYITRPYTEPEAFLENPNLLAELREQELKSLYILLKPSFQYINTLKRIECFDVSHTAGTSTTASMVTFINAEPEKNLYRRFRVRTLKRADDFAAMGEIIRRRLGHLEDWGTPDLIVVDGGKPQVSAAKTALNGARVEIPVIGLAKRIEEIIIPVDSGFKTLRLSAGNPALTLLQRLRDEAHRFARNYHFKLRIKELRA